MNHVEMVNARILMEKVLVSAMLDISKMETTFALKKVNKSISFEVFEVVQPAFYSFMFSVVESRSLNIQ